MCGMSEQERCQVATGLQGLEGRVAAIESTMSTLGNRVQSLIEKHKHLDRMEVWVKRALLIGLGTAFGAGVVSVRDLVTFLTL